MNKMAESKTKTILIMFMSIFGTLFLSGLFQNNIFITSFYLIGFLISLAIYYLEYSIRRIFVQRFRNPLNLVIEDLKQFDRIKEDPKLKRKTIMRLYRHLKLTEFIEGSFKVIPSNSPIKPSFKFQEEGEESLLTIQFFILSGDQPYQFQLSGKNENYYSNLTKQAPSLAPEDNTKNLERLIVLIKECIPQK